ncbi:hypothetical protein ABEF95_011214 [Exophiala dermatitidis]
MTAVQKLAEKVDGHHHDVVDPHSRPRRRRRPVHEKSKTGCTTCKARKVKCDETKPYCRRCTESGRECDGPVSSGLRFIHEDRTVSKDRGLLYLSEISLGSPQHDSEERRAFHHFLHRAAPVFAGVVDSSFWLDLVPRLAQSSPFVWDAVVSISWLFEHVPYDRLVTNLDARPAVIVSQGHRQALQWYTRAITSLRQHIDQGEVDAPLALVSCILFVSVEYQQRNIGNALVLMEMGHKLLAQSILASSRLHQSLPNSSALGEVVTPFFSRHAVLVATLGSPLPPDWNSYIAENTDTLQRTTLLASLSALDEPRAHLYSLTYRAYEVIRAEQLRPTEHRIIRLQRMKQELLLQELRQWETAFVNKWSYDKRTEILWAVSSLLIYCGVCYIWLSTCTSPLQTVFDDHMDLFATILKHAEEVLEYSVESTTTQPILTCLSAAGLVRHLYFCATKCRDPLLRRKALGLMQQVPTGNGLWASVANEKVIEKIISMEEGVRYYVNNSQTKDPGPLPLPPEQNRIHHVAVVKKDVSGSAPRLALQLSKCVATPDRSKTTISENIWLDLGGDNETRENGWRTHLIESW